MTHASDLVEALDRRGWSVAVAESLTGGLLLGAIVDVAGASRVLNGGIVAYNTALKHSLVGVDADLLNEAGAVDPRVAQQMADRIRRACAIDGRAADVGVATTGVAGPDLQDGKPPGTVYIAVATPAGSRVHSLRLTGDRDMIRRSSVESAIDALLAEVGE